LPVNFSLEQSGALGFSAAVSAAVESPAVLPVSEPVVPAVLPPVVVASPDVFGLF